jgi:hypothetical protein
MTMLIVTEPQTIIAVIVGEVVYTSAVLLVLEPLAFISLTVEEGVDTVALTLSAFILPFVGVAILVDGTALPVSLTKEEFSLILTSIFSGSGTKGNLLTEYCLRQNKGI